MGRAGADKGMHPTFRSRFHCTRRRFDVGFVQTRQRTNARAFNLAGNGLHGSEIAWRSGGEACLNNIDIEITQRVGDNHFRLDSHRKARRLFAVAQCGVEDFHMGF